MVPKPVETFFDLVVHRNIGFHGAMVKNSWAISGKKIFRPFYMRFYSYGILMYVFPVKTHPFFSRAYGKFSTVFCSFFPRFFFLYCPRLAESLRFTNNSNL